MFLAGKVEETPRSLKDVILVSLNSLMKRIQKQSRRLSRRLGTSLCLQFHPFRVAAGVTFLAAKFSKVRLPSDGEKVWWQELDVTPRQLEEVGNQMLELYE